MDTPDSNVEQFAQAMLDEGVREGTLPADDPALVARMKECLVGILEMAGFGDADSGPAVMIAGARLTAAVERAENFMDVHDEDAWMGNPDALGLEPRPAVLDVIESWVADRWAERNEGPFTWEDPVNFGEEVIMEVAD